MCLTITLKCSKPVSCSSEKHFGNEETLHISAKRTSFRQRTANEFNVSDLKGGKACACGLLARADDEKGMNWTLNENLLDIFAATLRRFQTLCSKDFDLIPSWSKQAPAAAVDVRLGEMTSAIQANRIAKNTQYRIR